MACRVDLAVCLDRRDYRTCGDVHIASLFDDSLKGRPDVPLALGEQAESMSMAVHAGAVCQPEFLSDGRWRPPPHKSSLDILALPVGAHRASPLVPSETDRRIPRATHSHIQILNRL